MTPTTIAPPPSAAGTIGANPLVTFNWNPATQLTHFLAAEAAVQAGTDGARVKIIALGDSTTAGLGGVGVDFKDTTSYPAQLTSYLTQDGLTAQADSFLGGALQIDNRISLVGGAVWSTQAAAGGQMVELHSAGDGFDFSPITPQTYDRVDVHYYDEGTGSANISVDGGPTLGTIQLGDTGQLKTLTITLPAGKHSTLSLRDVNSSEMLIEGASFWSSTDPSIEVSNAGVIAATSATVGTGTLNGLGEIQGAVEAKPTLAFINYGINDINAGFPAAETAANLKLMVDDLRSVGCDPVIIIPQPFNAPNYAAGLPALRSAVQALALAENVPVIDLSATYNDDFNAISKAGLMTLDLHPNSILYADIAAGYAALLASAVNGTAVAPVATVPASAPPAITVTSEKLTSDTGVSASDHITSNGAVILTGMVSGASGTVVRILDGSTTLGNATLDGNGGWTFATTLAAGTHTLNAVAADPAGTTAAAAAPFPIVVETAAPVLTIAAPTETSTATSATITITGTVSGAAGTKVEIFNNTTDLGAATLDGKGGYSFTDTLQAGTYTFKATATDPAGNTASATDGAFTATLISQPAQTDTPTPPASGNTNPVTIASTGSDTLVLKMAEDDYNGDAQFTVSVDGAQIGGTQTVTALHGSGQTQDFTLQGDFGPGTHTVAVNFLNDAWLFTSTGLFDRNLYVSSISLNGVKTDQNAEQYSNGPANYAVTAGTTTTTISASTPVPTPVSTPVPTPTPTPVPTPLPTPPATISTTTVTTTSPGSNTLVLNMAEDAYNGDAQFTVSVDGTQIGGTQTVTALHGSGNSQDFAVQGNFGPGAHTVAVNFLNDAWLFTSTGLFDRNLYVNSITLDGVKTVQSTEQYSNGPASYAISIASVQGTPGNDTLIGTAASNLLTGNGGSDTYIIRATDQTDTIVNGNPTTTAAAGQLDMASSKNQLWFERSGNDLKIDVLGTKQAAVISDWYAHFGSQLQSVVSSDGFKIDSGIESLVQAMATFSASNAGFNPMTASGDLSSNAYGVSLAAAVTSAWHH